MTELRRQLCQFAKPLSVALALSAVANTGIADSIRQTQSVEPTGRLIVKYRTASQPWQTPRGSKRFLRSTLRDNRQLSLERSLSSHTELVWADFAPELKDLKARAEALNDVADVEYASVEYRRFALLQPNDPLYQGNSFPGNQSYLYDGVYSMRAPGAWDITTGSSSSVIAIVDTGVLPDHPGLTNRSVPGLGYDFVSPDGPGDFFSANDNDGRDNNPFDPGDPCNTEPSTWHGSAVASVAAGNSNDAEGAAGVDWNAQLLHARALGICGGTDADIIDAIRWSAGLSVPGIPDNQNPANVVNVSLGGPTECTRAWQDVIDDLAQRDVVVVMAAGNENNNALRSAPANCANVITVGSSTLNGNVDSLFSNYGLKVAIATSGRNIIGASNRGVDSNNPDGNFYRTETGTSFSAALVSGAVSLMHSLDPNLGPSAVRALLHQSATEFAAGTNCDLFYCGAGILDLSRTMAMLRDGNFDRDRNFELELIQSQALPASLQQSTDASLFGFRDIRYFAIDIPERGLFQAESSGDGDIYGYLLNPQLSVVALDDDSGDATNFRVAALVEPGTYYLAVERARHRLSDGELQFAVSANVSSNQPEPFTFTPATNVNANALLRSNTITVDGLVGNSIVTISDGFYSLNGGALTTTPAVIRNGDTLMLAVQSPGAIDSTNIATVSVGAYTTSFSATTGDDSQIFAAGGSAGSAGCTINKGAAFDPLLLLSLLLAGTALRRRPANG